MLADEIVNPDGQPPLPLPAAEAYAQAVAERALRPLPPSLRAWRDLAYGEHRLQRCNVFAPAAASAAPVLVFWHGGGWTHGYRQWASFMAPHLAARGWLLVAPSYRLAPQAPLPAAFDDALALLAWLVPRLAGWGGDGRRVFLSGHSAGGHLAALAALRGEARAAAGVPAGAVRGCLPVSAILDLHDPAPAPGSLEERVYTTVLRGQDPLLDTVLSPLHWAAGHRLPFDLAWGERDSPRVVRSNRRLAALLQAQGAPVRATVGAGEDHFQTHLALDDPAHPWYERLDTLAREAA